MLGFLVGLVVGGIFGVIVMALMRAASDADDQITRRAERKDTAKEA